MCERFIPTQNEEWSNVSVGEDAGFVCVFFLFLFWKGLFRVRSLLPLFLSEVQIMGECFRLRFSVFYGFQDVGQCVFDDTWRCVCGLL